MDDSYKVIKDIYNKYTFNVDSHIYFLLLYFDPIANDVIKYYYDNIGQIKLDNKIIYKYMLDNIFLFLSKNYHKNNQSVINVDEIINKYILSNIKTTIIEYALNL